MPNIVAIVSDDRVRKQIERFVGEMSGDFRVATFSSAKDFEATYFKPVPPPAPTPPPKLEAVPDPASADAASPPVEEKKEDGPVDLRLFGQVHMLIFASDSLNGEKVPAWSTSMMRRLKERGYWPEGNRTRFVLLKFEDDGVHKLDVLLRELDDLIYLPLDRLIFLQKIEVIMGLPKKVKGSYLFNQVAKHEIEISKITKLEKFSDIGLAVRNPVPLLPGMRAKFYVQLPGDKDTIRFFAKCIRSEPHPELPDHYLIYFSFFGLRKSETTRIRQWLTRGPKFKMFVKEDVSKFKLNSKDLEAVERAGPMKTIAIIDPATDQATGLATQIRNEMDNIQVITESSYNYFVHKYMKGAATASPTGGPPELPKATKADEFPNGMLQLQINMENKQLQKLNYTPAEEDLFFGYIAKDIFKTGATDWWLPLKNVENDMILDEAVNLLKENKVSGKVLILKSATGEKHAVTVKVSPEKDATSFALEISPASPEAMADELGTTQLPSLDAIVIDAAFIPSDFGAWMEFLKTTALEKGLIKRPENLKIILTTDRENRLERAWLDSPHIVGLMIKPVDNRQLLFLLAEALQSKFTPYCFDNIALANTFVNCHMSREIDIELIAEFGATLRSTTPFRPGTFFFLRKMIFDNAPNQCLAARVCFCEPHPEVKGQFQVSVLYYGINEMFLKFARTWIREFYAQSKAQA